MATITSIPSIDAVFRFPRAGKIRLGIKKVSEKSGKEYPAEVDYFVCPEEVQSEFGEQPKELKIALPSNEISEVLPYSFKWYKHGAGLICKGNGEIAYQVAEEPGKGIASTYMKEIECPGVDCPYFKSGKECRLSASFFVLLPHVDTFRVYQIDTNSWNSVVNLLNSLRRVQTQYQRLMNLHHPDTLEPILRLVRMPQETHGSGRKEIHYTMSLYADMPLKLLRQIRDGLSNPHLLAATTATGQEPGETRNDFKTRIQKGINDMFAGHSQEQETVVVDIAEEHQENDLPELFQAALKHLQACRALPEIDNVKGKYVQPIWERLDASQREALTQTGIASKEHNKEQLAENKKEEESKPSENEKLPAKPPKDEKEALNWYKKKITSTWDSLKGGSYTQAWFDQQLAGQFQGKYKTIWHAKLADIEKLADFLVFMENELVSAGEEVPF